LDPRNRFQGSVLTGRGKKVDPQGRKKTGRERREEKKKIKTPRKDFVFLKKKRVVGRRFPETAETKKRIQVLRETVGDWAKLRSAVRREKKTVEHRQKGRLHATTSFQVTKGLRRKKKETKRGTPRIGSKIWGETGRKEKILPGREEGGNQNKRKMKPVGGFREI